MRYKLFEEHSENGHPGFLQSVEDIHAWLKENDRRYHEDKYRIINSDMSVDVVNEGVEIFSQNLTYIKVNFNKVSKFFDCGANELLSLKGAPRKVNGHFKCDSNLLTTLQYAPAYVGERFECTLNVDLVTLAHKSNIQGDFIHDKLEGTLEQRWNTYVKYYLNIIDEEEKKSSLQWLYDVDEDFRELIVKYKVYHNIDINTPGVDMDIAKDASKHNDSGLF